MWQKWRRNRLGVIHPWRPGALSTYREVATELTRNEQKNTIMEKLTVALVIGQVLDMYFVLFSNDEWYHLVPATICRMEPLPDHLQ